MTRASLAGLFWIVAACTLQVSCTRTDGSVIFHTRASAIDIDGCRAMVIYGTARHHSTTSHLPMLVYYADEFSVESTDTKALPSLRHDDSGKNAVVVIGNGTHQIVAGCVAVARQVNGELTVSVLAEEWPAEALEDHELLTTFLRKVLKS